MNEDCQPSPPRTRSAFIEYRQLGNEELAALRDTLAYEVVDLEIYGAESAPVAALLVGERLAAVDLELARRARLHAAGAGVPDPRAARYELWRDVAAAVRERADVVAVFLDGGYHLRQTGPHEWHGRCLVCREGDDRLMVRTDPPGRYWCRVCGVGGDAITAHRTLTGAGFFGAVKHLAAATGVPLPPDTTALTLIVRRAGREAAV